MRQHLLVEARQRCRDFLCKDRLPLFELARVLVRFDDIASIIVNVNHRIM
jgi:hypothetical protein